MDKKAIVSLAVLAAFALTSNAQGQTRPRPTALKLVDPLKRWENHPLARGKVEVDRQRYDALGRISGEIGYGFTPNGLETAKKYGVLPRDWVMPKTLTDKQAHVMLTTIFIPTYDKVVQAHVKVPLTVNQRNALVMFAYNLGETALVQLVEGPGRLNSGNYKSVERLLPLYVNSKAKKNVPGLVARRQAELAIWAKN